MNIYKAHSKALLLILLCFFSFTNIAHSQTLSASEVIEKAWPCVVKISVLNEDDSCFTGTGFFISPKRILTCEHVIRKARYVTVIFDDDPDSEWIFTENITILKLDNDSDLALLEVDLQYQSYLSLADNYEYRLGQTVYTVGFPLGGTKSSSEGIISTEIISDSQFGYTAPVSPGNSGSPVLDQKGNVVGMSFASNDEGQNLNAAISIKAIQEFLAQHNSPYKVGIENNDKSEDPTSLVGSALKEVKKTGLAVVNFIVFTGRGIFFTVVDIIILFFVFLLIFAGAKVIFRSFAEGTYKRNLKKLFLVFMSSSMLFIWLIVGIFLYNLLFPLAGNSGFLMSVGVFGTSIIIGTIFYFMMKKIWKRHAKAT